MKTRRMVTMSIAALVLVAGFSVYSQVKRPYQNGSVWNIAFIRMKPGMESAYLDYLSGPWKANQEAAKKEGLILSYKVLSVEGHNPNEWNLMLMTQFKDLATMEANEDKADELAQRMVGNDDKQRQGYKDRSEIREVVGDRLAREIVLESKSR